MVSIVVNHHLAVVARLFQPKLKATFSTEKCLYGIFHHLVANACKRAYSHRCHSVFDVNIHRHSEHHIVDATLWRHKIKHYLALPFAHILGMKIALIARIVIHLYSLLRTRLQLQSGVHYQRAAGLHQFREVSKTLQISFLRAVNVKVVGVSSCDYCHIWVEPMKRAVKFVSLNHSVRAVGRKHKIAVVVAQDASQKSITSYRRGMKDMSCHTRSGGFAMSARKTQAFGIVSEQSQHLSPFHHVKTAVTKITQSRMVGGQCRGVDHQCGVFVAAIVGDKFYRIIVDDFSTLFFKLRC